MLHGVRTFVECTHALARGTRPSCNTGVGWA